MAKGTTTRKPSDAAIKQRASKPDQDFDLDDLDSPPAKVLTTPTPIAPVKFERSMTGKREIFTDLFKLAVAKVIKYEGWEDAGVEHPDTHPSKFSNWEHTHPFRTYDRKGMKQTTSTPIGGHFHLVEWDKDADGNPVIKSVSGPMVMGKTRVKGKQVNMPVPANEFDDHTHDVEYIHSAQIQVTTTNLEAAKVIAFEANKTAPIPGVQER